MPNLETLSASKLHALIEKREATNIALLDEVIAAGYGQTTMSEVRRLARDEKAPLLVEYVAAMDSLDEARHELDARRRYHGGDKPIRRAA